MIQLAQAHARETPQHKRNGGEGEKPTSQIRESFPDFATSTHERSIWFSYSPMRQSLPFNYVCPLIAAFRFVGKHACKLPQMRCAIGACVVMSIAMVAATMAPPQEFPPSIPLVQRPTTQSPGQLPSSISATKVPAKAQDKNSGSGLSAATTSATRVVAHNRWLVTFTFTPTLSIPKQVSLAGDFNNWNKLAAPMQRAKDGSWSTSVELPEGAHLYKFVVDGDT